MKVTLLDGEARAHEFPDTFEIPPLEARKTLCVGDYAKLCLQWDANEDEDNIGGERPWFEVTAVVTGRDVSYLGKVVAPEESLQPATREFLKWTNGYVAFKPCNVIAIERAAEAQ